MGFSGKCSSLGQLDKDLSKCPKTPRAGSDTAYDAIKGAAGWVFSRLLVGRAPARRSVPAVMSFAHDESSAATLAPSGIGAGDRWHVEDGDFVNARLSNTPW